MALPEQRINTGSFVPTTNIWDVARLYEIAVDSPEFKELLVRLYQNVNTIAIALNTKDSALYFLEEFVTGQLWFNANSSDPNDQNQGFRRVYNSGAITAGITSLAH